jgi:ATP-dependent Clp protease ATP-binding subunit ClpX
VELEFTPEALRELAAQAMKKGTGARALRSLLEKLMLDVMFEIPTNEDIVGVKITRPVVLGETKPLLRRKADQAGDIHPADGFGRLRLPPDDKLRPRLRRHGLAS